MHDLEAKFKCKQSLIDKNFYFYTIDSFAYHPTIKVNSSIYKCTHYHYSINFIVKRENHIFDNKINLDYIINSN